MVTRRKSVPTGAVFALVLTASLARAAEPIANWPAPPSWDPGGGPTADGPRRGLSTESAIIRSPLPFVGVTPCRIADTRGNGFSGLFGPPSLVPGSARGFPITGQCGIPIGAEGVSLNVTVTNTQGPGFLTLFPNSEPVPTVSTLNYVAGQTVANAAVVPISVDGAVDFLAGVSGTDVIIDTNGFYGNPTSTQTSVFLGSRAGNASSTGSNNTGVGQYALSAVTSGSFNTALGHESLGSDTTGASNTALGAGALFNNVGGSNNTAVGYQALVLNGGGNDNTAVGYQAGFSNSSGGGNVAIGRGALFNNVTGNYNIAVGWNAGVNTTGSNNILIGAGGVAGESNTIRIGDASYHMTFVGGIFGATLPSGVQVFVNSSGKLGTNTSSRRFKEDIRDIGAESDRLMELRPVAFEYKPEFDPSGLTQYGLIAEEVEAIYPNLVARGLDGRPLTVRYHLVNALLLNEVQKQRRSLDEQQPEIERLEKRLSNLEAQLGADPRQ